MRQRILVFSVIFMVSARVAAKDPAIAFSPPPFSMTNLVVNDAIEARGIDYMGMKGTGLNLSCANYGGSSMDRYWEKGGFVSGGGFQGILGSFDTGGPDPFTLYGVGGNLPFTWFFDPISREDDDNSLPIYGGFHLGAMMLSGTMKYTARIVDHEQRITIGPGIYYWSPVYADTTATTNLSMDQVQVGWHLGMQWGVNLGSYLKVIPYVNLSQDVYNLVYSHSYTSYSEYGVRADYYGTSPPDSSSQTLNLGVQPVAVAPGFDVILRKVGLSLGGAYQSVKQPTGNLKQINLHLRWSTKFRSICGA